MGDLMPHLAWREVLRGSGVSSPSELPLNVRANIERTAREMFQPIRVVFNAPLIVVSGYRDPATNKAANGKPRSKHMDGLALDLVPAAGKTDLPRLYDLVAAMQKSGRIPAGGLCLYLEADARTLRFLHVDAGGTRRRWDKLDAATGRWVSVRQQQVGVA